MLLQCKLSTTDLDTKRIFLRADLNDSQTFTPPKKNTFRLKSILPTLNLIKERGGRTIVCSHYGRPTNCEPSLSTEQFVPWFNQQGFKTKFARTVEECITLSAETDYDLIVLENIRFFPEEEACDITFANKLAKTADYYVNDAFGSCHRTSASLTVLPTLFETNDRSIGLLIEKELAHLNPLITDPKHPYALMIGGIKGATKLPLIHQLLPKIDILIITTPLCFTFFKAMGIETGRSYVENSMIKTAEAIIKEAKKQTLQLLFPHDFQITETSFESPKKIRLVNVLGPNDIGISVGPESTNLFKEKLLQAKMLFLNGLPGNTGYIETLESTRILLHALQRSSGTTVIGGGDSIALVHQLGCDDVGYLSTGGGATLAYLSNQMLPALTVFMQ